MKLRGQRGDYTAAIVVVTCIFNRRRRRGVGHRALILCNEAADLVGEGAGGLARFLGAAYAVAATLISLLDAKRVGRSGGGGRGGKAGGRAHRGRRAGADGGKCRGRVADTVAHHTSVRQSQPAQLSHQITAFTRHGECSFAMVTFFFFFLEVSLYSRKKERRKKKKTVKTQGWNTNEMCGRLYTTGKKKINKRPQQYTQSI